MKTFTGKEIETIYHTTVLRPPSYFEKYHLVPSCPVKQWNHSWGGRDFPRVWCVLDFQEWVAKHGIGTGDILGYTCAIDPELEFVDYDERILVDYPPHDLHLFDRYSGTFDLFVFNQTLEHLYNPFLAVQNIYKSIKPGGYVFTSVPTLNIPHMMPFHFNGFTPMGLAMLFLVNGFEVVEMGQWGNYKYIQSLWANHLWPCFNRLNQNGYVTNEEKNVCQCWILAKRPL